MSDFERKFVEMTNILTEMGRSYIIAESAPRQQWGELTRTFHERMARLEQLQRSALNDLRRSNFSEAQKNQLADAVSILVNTAGRRNPDNAFDRRGWNEPDWSAIVANVRRLVPLPQRARSPPREEAKSWSRYVQRQARSPRSRSRMGFRPI